MKCGAIFYFAASILHVCFWSERQEKKKVLNSQVQISTLKTRRTLSDQHPCCLAHFLSRGIINYVGLEHPLNTGDMNASVMKETGTMWLNYSISQSLLHHVINNRKAILF